MTASESGQSVDFGRTCPRLPGARRLDLRIAAKEKRRCWNSSRGTRRILDLGTGDGRLLALVRELARQERPETEAVAVDFSPAMLEAVRGSALRGIRAVRVVEHNLDEPLPESGQVRCSDLELRDSSSGA